ncbi:carboxypeptidase-like regulatory domain-containing protein [Cellulophaga baltica 4]|nr:carboxypeptidase-like regulatory domain-containing protein [Cellulophaga baltica 4]
MRNKHFSMLLLFLFLLQISIGQELTIKGVVNSSTEQMPLPGASIILKGTTIGTTSDFDGKFQINASLNATLVISYIGYGTKEIQIKSNAPLSISLEEGELLDEVVITALGIKREKKALGYAVQAVKADELLEGNQTNMVNGLQGKVSGVTVVNSGGAPGSSAVILIRGGTSITGNNQPLFVVDGIPIDNSTSSSLEVASINRASDINPEDIETVSVFKRSCCRCIIWYTSCRRCRNYNH